METWVTALIAAIGVAVSGAVAALIVQRAQRRKTSADADKSVAEGAGEVVDSALSIAKEARESVAALKAEITNLKAELAERDKRENKMQAELDGLRLQVRDLNQKLARVTTENAQLRQLVAEYSRE